MAVAFVADGQAAVAQQPGERSSGTNRNPRTDINTERDVGGAPMLGAFLSTTVVGLTMHADGLPALLLIWSVVAVINIAYALTGRPRS